MNEFTHLIDISQPIERTTAIYPGDTPFDYSIKASFAENGAYNLTSFRMSPHIGSHADAPAHVLDEMDGGRLAGGMPLMPFIGPCYVLDLCPFIGEILPKDIEKKVLSKKMPARVLFRTRRQQNYETFETEYAYLSLESVDLLQGLGVKLIGMDTCSVDGFDSGSLKVHHALIERGIYWLENLDLTQAEEREYFLSALPIKFMELEAAPVRAVLLY